MFCKSSASLIALGGVCALLALVAPAAGATPPVFNPSAAVAPVVAQELAAASRWRLGAGQPIHTQLQAWATQAGWQLNWQPKVSWLVAADTEFEGSFESAVQEVIQGLYFEGKPVRLVLWEGNRYAEVVNHDVR